MASSQFTPQELQEIREQAACWGKNVARRAFGEAGPGLEVDLLALEQLADAAARGLHEGTLAALLEQQAHALPPQQPCPDCGHLCPISHADRPLACSGGSTLTYHEPVGHCPACRRAFFPSAADLTPRRP